MRREEEEQDRAIAEMASGNGDLPAGTGFDENDQVVPSGHEDEQEQDDPEIPRRWLKREVARHFRVHYKTIEVWRRKHGLPCLKLGGSVRYEISDVLRWASARKEGV